MAALMTRKDIERSTDVDELWTTFRAAREAGDVTTADAARDRMAALEDERQRDTMDDGELSARVSSLRDAQQFATEEAREVELRRLEAEAERRGLML